MSKVVAATETPALEASWLRQVALEAGADDVGFVSVSRPEVATDRADILWAFPPARTLIGFVSAMNPDAIRTPARSVANTEFHHAGDQVNRISARIVSALRERGHRGINPAMGFPMEMGRFPDKKIWVLSHKLVAEAAGLGKMGIHRNLIHPRLGNFILLGTVITDATVTEESQPLDTNPCLECKLCVAACPVGAVKSDGGFDFSACYTHNYREFLGGFTDWVEQIAESRNARDYRARVPDPESVSMWQSLAFGANYKAAYCMAVCPAGETVSAPYQASKKQYLQTVVKPLQLMEESVYVVAGTDAEQHVGKRFPHKRVRRVGSGLRPQSIDGFLLGLPHLFQRGVAKKLEVNAIYHFTFTGETSAQATVQIQDGAVRVETGHEGSPNISVTADSRAWLEILAKNRGMLGAVLTGKLKVKGPLRLMKQFAACFPL